MILEASYVGLIKLIREWVKQGKSPEEIALKMIEEPARSLLESSKGGSNPIRIWAASKVSVSWASADGPAVELTSGLLEGQSSEMDLTEALDQLLGQPPRFTQPKTGRK